MPETYYIDTSIWIDLYEDRKGYNNEPLGYFASKLFGFIKAKKDIIVISDLLIKELELRYSQKEINNIIKPFEDLIDKVFTTKEQRQEAYNISKERNIPSADVLHAIIARDNKFILITRDNHFKELKNIYKYYKPEELI